MASSASKLVAYAQGIIRFRWAVLVLTVLTSLALAYGAQYLQFSTNYRVFFSDENPQLMAFEEFQNTYTKSDFVSFVIKTDKDTLFEPRMLEGLQFLTEESWKLPYASRVDSLTNYQHTEAEEDDLIVADLVEEAPSSYSPQRLAHFENVAKTEPTIASRLISTDGLTTQVAVTMQFTGDDPAEVVKSTMKSRELLAVFNERYPEFQTALSGTVVMNSAFMEASFKDMQTLVPLKYAAVLLLLVLLLRSIFGTLATLSVMSLSAMAAMGVGGWLGYPLTPPSSSAMTVVITLAVADSVHILATLYHGMRQGLSRDEAIVESIRVNFKAVFITSVTTAIGFLSLNFSDAPPFRHLGNMSAAGVMWAFILAVTILPALMAILPVRKRAVHEGENVPSGMDKLADFVVGYRRVILPVMVVIAAGLTAFVPKLELNDQFVQYFDESMTFRQDTDFMLENLTGIYQAEYSIAASESGGVSNPEYLNNLEAFTTWLENQPEVLHVHDMGDVYKRLNKNMHGDDERYYRVPESRELAAQYMLLYEMSLPYGLDVNDRLSVDKSASRVTVTLKDLSTKELRAFKDRSEAWLKDNAPAYMAATATSPAIMFSYISQRNIESMMTGNAIALIAICIIIGITLNSFRMGLFSMIPNILPALMAFGTWAIIDGQVNMVVSMVTAMSLGIIVDDTVHFLSKYDRARKEKGASPEEAVRYAFHTVGYALIVTTVTLVIGFSILAQSAFEMNSAMGVLTAISIFMALVVDFFLLPTMLMAFDKRKFKQGS
jgi:predicted RND superfamily exporter protein